MPDTVAKHESNEAVQEALDLSAQVLDAYWSKRSIQLYRVICEMERAENWPIDSSDRIAEAIERFGHKLSSAAVTALATLPHDELILVLGYISAGRGLRVYQFLYERAPDTAIDILETCRRRESARPTPSVEALSFPEERRVGEAAHAHLERLRQIERTLVLSRVFGPSNVAPLLNALIAVSTPTRAGETS